MKEYHKRHAVFVAFLILINLLGIVSVSGQIQLAGDLAYTQRFIGKHLDLNTNFRGDDPFHLVRARVFLRNWISDDVGVFTEFLFDTDTDPRVNGAYIVINNLIQDKLNLKAGLIPSPFGNYGLRSTYFNLNPVIGTPVMWHYKSAMVRSAQVINVSGKLDDTNRIILNNKVGEYSRSGTPIAYDACWETGVELNGQAGKFEYTLAILNGALSNPVKAENNDGYSSTLKVGWDPVLGMRLGISGDLGSYLTEITPANGVNLTDKQVKTLHDPKSYLQKTGGVYFEYLFGHWQLFSEGVYTSWDVPGLSEHTLSAYSGYLDARWDFLPAWFLAARVDYMSFSEIRDTRTGSTTFNQQVKWDTPFSRFEPGIGWRFRREGLLKLVYQYWNYTQPTRENESILALQVHMVF